MDLMPGEVRALARLAAGSVRLSEVPVEQRGPYRYLVTHGLARLVYGGRGGALWSLTTKGRDWLNQRTPT